MRLAKRLAFLGFDFFFGLVKGEKPLTRRAERKPFDQKKKAAPRHQRENHFWFYFDTQKRTKLSAKAIYKYKKTFKFSS